MWGEIFRTVPGALYISWITNVAEGRAQHRMCLPWTHGSDHTALPVSPGWKYTAWAGALVHLPLWECLGCEVGFV